MKSLMCLLIVGVLMILPCWSLAQPDAKSLCQQYAAESGLSEEEIADYVADCMINLGDIDSEPPSVNLTDNEESGSSTAEDETSESTQEYASDATAAEQATENDTEEAVDEFARGDMPDPSDEEAGLVPTSPFGK